jgi:8-oxo-dGTP diphosphatase
MPAPYCYEYPRPLVTVDLVVFTLVEQSLRVLLIRRGREPFAGKWAIPGGFLEIDEPVEAGARRELREETGLEIPGPVEPIGFFGKPGRDPRDRTITLAHAAVIRPGEHQLRGGDDASEAAWVELGNHAELAFDHDEILSTATDWLKRGVIERSLGLNILPQSFISEDVHGLFRSLGLQRRRAYAWLGQMMRAGRITSSGGPKPHLHLAESAR